MRTIEQSSQFKKDLKRESRGRHTKYLVDILEAALTLLVNDQALPVALRDHALNGKWQTFRDCHLRPDLVLIYKKSEPEILELLRLGSHSELGL
jgi:mRNA interferase YafQ